MGDGRWEMGDRISGFPDGDDHFAGGFKGFDVGEANFAQGRDFSGIVAAGVFSQGGIESFKGGAPGGREGFLG